jgi:hypothetical protein
MTKFISNWVFNVSMLGSRLLQPFLTLFKDGETETPKPFANYDSIGGIPSQIFCMLRDWLRRCERGHYRCSLQNPIDVPKRLLDVSGDTGNIRLVETDSEIKRRHVRYVTLSHCWGRDTNHLPKTTHSNYSSHMRGIPFATLPRTFRDAVIVTRELGMQFLWIDSLCIRQYDNDDWDDWEQQSIRMASTYANCTLSLEASASSDSRGGMMLERSELQVTPFSWTQGTGITKSENPYSQWMKRGTVTWTLDPSRYFASAVSGRDLPLTSRAWVLQESVLAPRTLHFLPGQIIWECREGAATECRYMQKRPSSQHVDLFPGSVTPLETPVTLHKLKQFLHVGRQDIQETAEDPRVLPSPRNHLPIQTNATLYKQWYDLVNEYTRRNLSHSNDRLPGIWALAEKFQAISGDDYHAGLWRKDLLNGLLFERNARQHSKGSKHDNTSLPSWSWASFEDKVKYFPCELPINVRGSNAVVSGLSVNSLGPFSMGRTSRATITLFAYTRTIECEAQSWNPQPEEQLYHKYGDIPELRQLSHKALYEVCEEYEEEMRYKPFLRDLHRDLGFQTSLREHATAKASNSSNLRSDWAEGTDCHFGWRGNRHADQELWQQRQEKGERDELHKILRSKWSATERLEMIFDTYELASKYAKKGCVLCVCILGRHGLLVMPKNDTATEYQRIGVFKANQDIEEEGWTRRSLVLV